MNFAPYQDRSPEIERALSPPPRDRPSLDEPRPKSPPLRNAYITRGISETQAQTLPSPSAFANDDDSYYHRDTHDRPQPPQQPQHRRSFSREERGQHLEAFQTSLPLRLDYEAMLAYILLPPAGGVLLLLLEHKSDYVRFHAWQSSMLFSALFVLHLLLSWSPVFSWILFVLDISLIVFLSMRAYKDVENLEHYEVPFFGRLANSFVDDE